jgi:hypothetical protein
MGDEADTLLEELPTERLLKAVESRFEASIFVGLRELGRAKASTVVSLNPHPAADGQTHVGLWGRLAYVWHTGWDRLHRYLSSDPWVEGFNL